MEEIGRVERKKREARERILKAAEDLFIKEKRYDDVTIREIARKADVSVGAMYLHFKTKEDILAHLFSEFIEKENFGLEKIFPGEGTGAEQLTRLVEYFDHLSRDPHLILFGSITFLNQKGKESLNLINQNRISTDIDKLIGIVAGIFEKGQADGSLRVKLDPRLTANVFVDVIISLMLGMVLKSSVSSFASGESRQYDLHSIFSVLKNFLEQGAEIAGKDKKLVEHS